MYMKKFQLDYKKDGVYLCLNIKEKENIYTNEVIDVVNRKKIKGYNLKEIYNVINSRILEPTKIADAQDELLIDEDIRIEISNDKMSAFLILLPPLGGNRLKDSEIIVKIKNVIKYGLYIKNVEEILMKRDYQKRILIAEGKNPINGRDGFIKYNFDTKNKFGPEVLENGDVNYKRLSLIKNVEKNQILAELISSTKGEEGIDVLGQSIPRIKGKDAYFKYGKNVNISNDGNMLLAAKNGQVRITDGRIEVSDIYEIFHNVDNSTGNIDFNGSVHIKGNVRTGFSIVSKGDIEINGVVEGANINSKGNVIICKGIQGSNKGYIQCKGELFSKYIENSTINSDGNISAEAIMHSKVFSKQKVILNGKKGLIVGGICKARKEIHAKIIGSEMETNTILEVGTDPELRSKVDNLCEQIYKIKDDIDRLDKSILILNRMAKANNLTLKKKKMLIKFLKVRKILGEKIVMIENQYKDAKKQVEIVTNGVIVVNDIIFPGVKIIIGNSNLFIREEKRKCKIFKENGEIVVKSLEN